jgi:hypothetical protein
VLDGSEDETWSLYLKSFNCSNLGTGRPENALCNLFVNKGINWSSSDESNRGKFSMSSSDNSFKCMMLTDITLDQFKTFISTNNIIAYYSLATPTNTEITDTTLINQLDNLQNLNSYNPTTNIMQENNDKPFILDATLLKTV